MLKSGETNPTNLELIAEARRGIRLATHLIPLVMQFRKIRDIAQFDELFRDDSAEELRLSRIPTKAQQLRLTIHQERINAAKVLTGATSLGTIIGTAAYYFIG